MKVSDDRLRDVLGITHVSYVMGQSPLAIVDSSLSGTKSDAPTSSEVNIDNFSFKPRSLTVKAGTTVTWTNKDDMPHNVVNTAGKFTSPVLDTDQKYAFTFQEPGSYPYSCKLHPMMTAKITVVG